VQSQSLYDWNIVYLQHGVANFCWQKAVTATPCIQGGPPKGNNTTNQSISKNYYKRDGLSNQDYCKVHYSANSRMIVGKKRFQLMPKWVTGRS